VSAIGRAAQVSGTSADRYVADSIKQKLVSKELGHFIITEKGAVKKAAVAALIKVSSDADSFDAEVDLGRHVGNVGRLW
jgi:hypothetical protein